MHAPATGLVMAELLLDGHASTIDIDLLRFDRFGKNNLIKETHVI
jgi:sarcosine oxidase subunit beta